VSRRAAGALGQDIGRGGRVQPRGAERGYERVGLAQVGGQQMVVLGRHGAWRACVASALYTCNARTRQPDGQGRALVGVTTGLQRCDERMRQPDGKGGR